MYEEIRKEAAAAAQEICQVAKLQKGQILVVGCSTSEVTGHTVGSDSSPAIGQAIYEGIQQVLAPKGIYLAAQCCEHLNRAIIVEAEAAGQAELCNVVPQPKAGGSFATAAYHGFQHPGGPGGDPGGCWPGHWRHTDRHAFEKGGSARPFGAEPSGSGHGTGCPGPS